MSRKIALLVGLFASACATTDPYRLDGPRSGAGIGLAPYAIREECFRLDRGERIDFYFSSTADVAFNIHYHDANAVVMPIERAPTREVSGDFESDRREIYCLMWEAGAEPALIDFRLRPVARRP